MLEAHYGAMSKAPETVHPNSYTSKSQNNATDQLANPQSVDVSQTENKIVQDEERIQNISKSIVDREGGYELSDSVDSNGLKASQDDSFGSFEIEILTPEKSVEEMDKPQQFASEDSVLKRGENSAKRGNSYSVCDKDRKMSQKEEAFQELLDDLDEDDILCTFDEDARKSVSREAPCELPNNQSLGNESSDVMSEERENSKTNSVNADSWSKGVLKDTSGKPLQVSGKTVLKVGNS